MKKNAIIGFLLFIILVMLLLIYFGTLTPDLTKATYSLEPQRIEDYKNKTKNCNIDVVEKLIAHYAVNDNKKEFNRWKRYAQRCRNERNITSTTTK